MLVMTLELGMIYQMNKWAEVLGAKVASCQNMLVEGQEVKVANRLSIQEEVP